MKKSVIVAYYEKEKKQSKTFKNRLASFAYFFSYVMLIFGTIPAHNE